MAIEQFIMGLGVFVLTMICHIEIVQTEEMLPAQAAQKTSGMMPVVSTGNTTLSAYPDSLRTKRFLLLTPQDKHQMFSRDLLLRPQDRYGVLRIPMRDSLSQKHSKLIEQEP